MKARCRDVTRMAQATSAERTFARLHQCLRTTAPVPISG
jgi:hypothetical protein